MIHVTCRTAARGTGIDAPAERCTRRQREERLHPVRVGVIEPCVRNQITPGCRIHTAKRQSPKCAASKSGQSKRDEHMFLLLDMGSLKRQLGCTLMTGRPCLRRIPWHHTQRCTRESRATSDEEPEPPTDRYAVVFPQEIRRNYTWKHASIIHGKERPTATH